jgi:hypothetical protein
VWRRALGAVKACPFTEGPRISRRSTVVSSDVHLRNGKCRTLRNLETDQRNRKGELPWLFCLPQALADSE